MNSNELADKLNSSNTNGNLCDEAATMLRQQQLEIEALKAKLNKYHLKEDLDRNLNLIYGKAQEK